MVAASAAATHLRRCGMKIPLSVVTPCHRRHRRRLRSLMGGHSKEGSSNAYARDPTRQPGCPLDSTCTEPSVGHPFAPAQNQEKPLRSEKGAPWPKDREDCPTSSTLCAGGGSL